MMKKFRLLFLTIFTIIAGTLLFGTESNATSLEDVKENINFANNNQEYIVSGKNEISINESIREASEQGTKEGKQAIVYIPKGVYNINDRILVNSNVYILFEDGAVITPELLKEMGILKKQLSGVKVLGNGELTKKLTVKANRFSTKAVTKIENIGGKAEVI